MKKRFKQNDIQFIEIENNTLKIVFRDRDNNYVFLFDGKFEKVKKEFIVDGKKILKSIENIEI